MRINTAPELDYRRAAKVILICVNDSGVVGGFPGGEVREKDADVRRCDIAAAVDAVFAGIAGDIVVAMPLGLGKPVGLIDALYRRVAAEPQRRLTILTALSLARPVETDPIAGRLLNPVFDRLYQHYSQPVYVTDLAAGKLPPNICVKEFYFKPGSQLNNPEAQRHYISSNYTFAARDVAAQGCNVVMQLVAQDPERPGMLSTSCNPDTSSALVEILRSQGRAPLRIGVIHPQLPYMYGEAELPSAAFDLLVGQGSEAPHGLFPVPHLAPIPPADYAIGLYASALVADGGSLQLGIGSMGDAIVQCLLLRHQHNGRYRQLLEDTGLLQRHRDLIEALGGVDAFAQGLYGVTEMFVEGFLALLKAGVLRRKVYDFWALQQLVNEGGCDPEALTAQVIPGLAELGVRELRGKDFAILQHHGFFRDDCHYREGHITAPNGDVFSANMANPDSQRRMVACLGDRLRNGVVLHGGFFLGSGQFYRDLRLLADSQRRQLAMCGVDKINQLDANPRLYRQQRQRARFINTGLNVSLNGAVASDTLENGQVVSGVGGQYNFVAMAHQLPGGRSILMIRAVRGSGKHAQSNIVWNYGSCTIPRHLRDIVITEYGIADLRSKSDEEVIIALICIADSRFQAALTAQAKAAGKLAAEWQLPECYRHNYPATVAEKIRSAGAALPDYPLGCDFRPEELQAGRALKQLASLSAWNKLVTLLSPCPASEDSEAVLTCLGLGAHARAAPLGIKSRLLARLLRGVLARTG